MSQRRELLILLFVDFLALNFGWLVFHYVRYHSGLFEMSALESPVQDVITDGAFLYLYWLVVFAVFGLYRSRYTRPLFDEFITVLKTLAFGTIFLILVVRFVWDPVPGPEPYISDGRVLRVMYAVITIAFVLSLRLALLSTWSKLLAAGIGRRPSLIIGERASAQELADKISLYPRLGYDVVGYITTNGAAADGNSFRVVSRTNKPNERIVSRLGGVADLEAITRQHSIKEVLVALDSGEHETLLSILSKLGAGDVGVKIVPDLYDIVSGQARTREIYGFPLIDINPEIMRPWEEVAKRTLDVVVSLMVVVIGFPFWLCIAALVKLSSHGPVLYWQERVGKNGKIFHIYKFRSMFIDADAEGDQWATKNDPRVTSFGRFLRKVHLDEIPQLINVLKGDMSLVGPRPEMIRFVHILSQEIPYYNRRLRVRPGITGLYQAMVDKYDENIEDVRDRVRYDLMYIESMSFRLDLKILLRTLYTVIRGKGQA
jgi:exopolysaccharide biosynthesis polyprenyl glycosylphosphotransferase